MKRSGLPEFIASPAGKTPLVSVIMPVYNAENTVARAIRSVLNQTYPYWELVIVVDGAQDDSLSIIQQQFLPHPAIRVIYQDNQGVAVARNRAVANSTGEYLAFLDADDIWFCDKLATEVETLSRQSSPVGFTYSWYYAFNEQAQLINIPKPYRVSGNLFDTILLKENVVLPSTAMLHRQVFEAVGGFQSGQHNEDWHFFLMAAKRFPAYPTCRRLALYAQSLNGRGRGKKFSDYDYAIQTYLSENPDLEALIGPTAYAAFLMRQKKSLFCSFLMYNRMDFARRLYPQIPRRDLMPGLKGKLAYISLVSGLNLLCFSRVLYQAGSRFVLALWWHRKTRWAFSHE